MLEPALALREAQRWLRDTTNREKADYFKREMPAVSGVKMPEIVAADLLSQFWLFRPGKEPRQPNALDFAHPFWWAAFYLTGV